MARVTPERTQRLRISGMKGPACAVKIEQALRQLAGAKHVEIDNEGIASIAGEVEPEDLIKELSASDYQIQPIPRQ